MGSVVTTGALRTTSASDRLLTSSPLTDNVRLLVALDEGTSLGRRWKEVRVASATPVNTAVAAALASALLSA